MAAEPPAAVRWWCEIGQVDCRHLRRFGLRVEELARPEAQRPAISTFGTVAIEVL